MDPITTTLITTGLVLTAAALLPLMMAVCVSRQTMAVASLRKHGPKVKEVVHLSNGKDLRIFKF
jgi:hypothetical protein